jgi:hypothetical protein
VLVGWKFEWYTVGFSFPSVNWRTFLGNKEAFLGNKRAFLGNIVLMTSKNSNVAYLIATE